MIPDTHPAWPSKVLPISPPPLASLGHHVFIGWNHSFFSTPWSYVSNSILTYCIQCLTSWSGERPWHCTVVFDPQPVIGPSLHLQPDFAKTLNPFMTWPYMLNLHPAPQTCSYHVLSYRASPLKRSAHWKDAHATPVTSDCTFVPILIQLLWPRFGETVSECGLFSTLLCLILTYLAGCEQIQSLHRLLWVVWTLSLLLPLNHRHAVQDKV